ncbi:MAG: electron transport complex subunit RsxC [Oscillospiraceae bacterium]
MPYKYYGGVHPDYMKTANKTPVTPIAPPKEVVLPMTMHIGAPNQPVVKVGDKVKMGQVIGRNDAPVSAPIHASVSGTVVAVEPRRHMLGDMVMSVVIENDGLDTPCEAMNPLTAEQLRDPDAIIARIREAGVVGMGGAMFPTAFKIAGARGKVDSLVINGAECEPYLCGDHRTMLEHPVELLKGIELVRLAHGLEKCYYGIEKNKQDAIDLLNSLNPAQYGVEIVPEEVKYPQGAEKLQIKANTNREVKPGGIPSGVGGNVVSTYTSYCIYRACYEGVPSIERVVTVAGSGIAEAKNLLVRFGTPLYHIFQEAGGFVGEPERICMGGPMMGICVADISAGLIKGAAGLLVFTEEDNREKEDPVCIRCGNCVLHCPMKLEPLYMYLYVNKGDLAKMEQYHVADCFECGSCSYGCPGRLPLTHTFKLGKALMNAHKAEEMAKAALLAAEKAARESATAVGKGAQA